MTWWTIIYHSATPKATSLRVAAATNNADHLFMAWAFHKPARHPIYRVRRGLTILCGYRYIWDTPNIAEQTQSGDTFTHSFHLPALPESSIIWYYLFAPGGPYDEQIQGPLMWVRLPSVLAWPHNVLVGTRTKGIYQTFTFSGPAGDHPTWSRHNTGLDSLQVWQLLPDPVYPVERAFAIAGPDDSRIVYRRNTMDSDAWLPLLTTPEACTSTGSSSGEICWIAGNSMRPGHFYVLFNSGLTDNGTWCLRTTDSGQSWLSSQIFAGLSNYRAGNISTTALPTPGEEPDFVRLYAALNHGSGGKFQLYSSQDQGQVWNLESTIGVSILTPRCQADPTSPNTVYWGAFLSADHPRELHRSEAAGFSPLAVDGANHLGLFIDVPNTEIWIHLTNHDFLKILAANHVWQSWDYCATWEDLGQTMVPVAHLHIQHETPGHLYLSRDNDAPWPADAGWPHVLFVSVDNGATLIGKCGAHAQQSDGGGDSIPFDCGGTCHQGVAPLRWPD